MIVPRRLGRACFTLGSRVWSQLREGPALFLVVAIAVGLPTFFGSRAMADKPAAEPPRATAAPPRPAVVHDNVPAPTVVAATSKASAIPAPLLGKGVTPSPRPGQPGLRAPSRKGQKAR